MTGRGAAAGSHGLQAERTGLAWTRTGLGMLANAALLSLREVTRLGPTPAIVPAALAVLLALATILAAWHRTAVLRGSPLPTHLAPTRMVVLTGCSVVALALVAGGALLR